VEAALEVHGWDQHGKQITVNFFLLYFFHLDINLNPFKIFFLLCGKLKKHFNPVENLES
jgi:hypothetical protein